MLSLRTEPVTATWLVPSLSLLEDFREMAAVFCKCEVSTNVGKQLGSSLSSTVPVHSVLTVPEGNTPTCQAVQHTKQLQFMGQPSFCSVGTGMHFFSQATVSCKNTLVCNYCPILSALASSHSKCYVSVHEGGEYCVSSALAQNTLWNYPRFFGNQLLR